MVRILRVSAILLALFGVRLVFADAQQTATLTKPVKMIIPYGETIAPAGTRVDVIAIEPNQVRISYMNSVQVVPIDSVKIDTPVSSSGPEESKSNMPASPGRETGSVDASRIEDSTYLVKTDKGQGSAFLLQLHARSYLVTNYHVLKGARTAQFINAAGSVSLATSTPIEVAVDRDLIRVPVELQATLLPAASPAINAAINVYGNPGGQQVITKESGSILGVGPNSVEVSAKFIPGNSGGPIVETGDDKVVGVATYVKRDSHVPAWVTKNTRFEEVRRFGVRVDDSVRWSPTSWSNLSADTELISSVDSVFNDALELARILARSPYRAPFSSKAIWSRAIDRTKAHQQFDGIIAAYNGTCKEFAWALDTPTGNSRLQQVNSLFAARIRAHSAAIAKFLKDASAEFGRTGYNFSTEYTRSDYQKIVNELGKFGDFVEKNSDKIAAQQVFQLAPASSKNSTKP